MVFQNVEIKTSSNMSLFLFCILFFFLTIKPAVYAFVLHKLMYKSVKSSYEASFHVEMSI